MIETLSTPAPKILGFKLQGKLHDEDYQIFVPAVEAALAAQGKIRLLAQFENFHGWDLHAAWDDLQFGVKHYADFERIALVGDQLWEAWMARFCQPFTWATVQYFAASDIERAWAWLQEADEDPAPPAG